MSNYKRPATVLMGPQLYALMDNVYLTEMCMGKTDKSSKE
jgi:hypothetical protein